MGLWSAYFIAKLLLFAGGYIGFNPWLNLVFAIFTALPPQNARQRFTKNLIAVPLAIMLLYHDSWLPPFARVLEQTNNLAAFTPAYLGELLLRAVTTLHQLEAIAGDRGAGLRVCAGSPQTQAQHVCFHCHSVRVVAAGESHAVGAGAGDDSDDAGGAPEPASRHRSSQSA
jgi:hypothetical protein